MSTFSSGNSIAFGRRAGKQHIWIEEDEGGDYIETPSNLAPPPPVVSDEPPPPPPLVTTSLSQESGFAPFETLFDELNLVAQATYNFWEPNEEVSTTQRGVSSLEDVPRYVHLSWDTAPDIKDPDEGKKRRMSQASDPGARSEFTQLSPFGFGSRAISGPNTNGVQWTPPHLQPENFDQNVASLANGFMAPGVIGGVSSVITGSVTVKPMPSPDIIDEDEFLSKGDMFEGISYPEMLASVWRWRSPVYGYQQGLQGNISPTAEFMKNSFFNNSFTVNPPNSNNVSLQAVATAGPAISMNMAAAQSATPQAHPRPFQLLNEAGMDGTATFTSTTQNTHGVKVKLIHTNMEGLVSPERVGAATSPEHAESIIAVSQFAGNLAVYAAAGFQEQQRAINIPSFSAPEDMKPLEYIGYVIEKFEQIGGSFRLVETINIPGREYDRYIDTKVKYGVPYRYRIRSIIRWCRPIARGVMGYDKTYSTASVAGLDSVAPNLVSFFGSEWSRDWGQAMVIDTTPPNPPDELVVRPHSAEKAIEITMKLPHNPQRDISKMTLWRKLQDEWGNDLTNWVQITEPSDPKTSQGTKLPAVMNFREEQDQETGRDPLAYNRSIVNQFVEFAPVNARFIDYGVQYFGGQTRYRYVYAAMCHTRHGEKSKLSDQLSAIVNPEWAKTGEYPVKFVSCAGVDRDFDTGVFSTYPERHIRSEVVQRPGSHFSLVAQARTAKRALNNNTYVARVESLDTGQHVDIPVKVVVNNMPNRVTDVDMGVIVPNSLD